MDDPPLLWLPVRGSSCSKPCAWGLDAAGASARGGGGEGEAERAMPPVVPTHPSSLTTTTTTTLHTQDAVLCDEILLRLPPRDLAAAAATCRGLRRAAVDGDAWRRSVLAHWGGGRLALLPTTASDESVWRALALHLAEENDDPHSLAADALAASSTDQPEEDVRNVLFPRSRPPPGSSASTYWSSAGSPTPDKHESVSLRLAHPLCVVRSITLRPFRAWFQPGAPVYAPRSVRGAGGDAQSVGWGRGGRARGGGGGGGRHGERGRRRK